HAAYGPAAGDPGAGAQPCQHADRLPLQGAMRVRVRPVPRPAAGVPGRPPVVGLLALPGRPAGAHRRDRAGVDVAGYVARRILMAIPTLFATSIVVFLLVRLMPGDVIDYITGGAQTLTPEQRHQMEHQLGLDQSLVQQYLHWMKGLLTGDMGSSLIS